jgi:hypothetical protein
MYREHLIKLPLLLVCLGLVEGQANGGDSEFEAALKAKGLSKTLSTWVIEDEKPVLAAMKEARAVFYSFAQVAERKSAAELLAAQSKMLDAQRAELQSNLNVLNQQIAQMPNPATGMGRQAKYYKQTAANNPLLAQKSQLQAALTETNQTQQAIKSQIPAPKDKATIDAEVKNKQEAFKTTLTDLRKQIDEVTKKYEALAADETVKKSIDHLKESTKAKVKLGPSDHFLAMMKEVDKAEQLYLGKTPPPSAAAKKKAAAKNKK